MISLTHILWLCWFIGCSTLRWNKAVGCCGHTNFVLILCVFATLTLALWFWNHTCTTRTLSPVSAASVSLTWKHQDRKISSIPPENGALPSTLKYFSSVYIFQQAHYPFDFQLTLTECSSLFGTLGYCLFKALARAQACFRAPAMEAALLSQYDIWCRRTALHQPASVNTEQSAAPTSKLSSEAGEIFFNLTILFVKLL